MLFMCCRKLSLCFMHCIRCVIHEVLCCSKDLFCKMLPVIVGYYGTDCGTLGCPLTCLQYLPWIRKYMLWRQNLRSSVMFCTVSFVLFVRFWSCVNLLLMMSRAGSTGTNVNRAFISYVVMYSLGCSMMSFISSIKFFMLYMWCIDFTTNGWRMLANSLATLDVTEHPLETIGLSGVSFLCIYGRPKNLGEHAPVGYIHLYMLSTIPNSFLSFLECLLLWLYTYPWDLMLIPVCQLV